ncbi:hypothetical protein RHSIM_Rhsim04G0160800 [Rhododendron simsii]|uniref:Uncharacterized protein n=1 Tax=Rhododendron simsii TaxID=118357 RepID=A0A834H766_RHOSS|nr:hypothetical protein RHSIM_Rhsim04G0160800 [Rhododendron simsii]
MATLLDISFSLLPTRSPTIHAHNHQPISHLHIPIRKGIKTTKMPLCFKVQAAKLPSGVIFFSWSFCSLVFLVDAVGRIARSGASVQSTLSWVHKDCRNMEFEACMIGLIGTFVVELILNKGILQVIGVDIGKGLDLPL